MKNVSLKLNLGCGATRPEGWINTDSSLNAQLQKAGAAGRFIAKKIFRSVAYDSHNVQYMNLNKRWKFRDGSVDIVYASHLFEHLSLVSAELFLKESYRTLKPGGVIRIVVPDIYKISKKYIQEYEAGNSEAADALMWAINMHREGQYGSRQGLFKKIILEMSGYPHQHKFMYDEVSLRKRLVEAGFRDILSLSYGISEYIPEIKEVEGATESYLSIYLEGKKQ